LADDPIPSTPREPRDSRSIPPTRSTRAVQRGGSHECEFHCASAFGGSWGGSMLYHGSGSHSCPIGPRTLGSCKATAAYRRGDDVRPGPRPRPLALPRPTRSADDSIVPREQPFSLRVTIAFDSALPARSTLTAEHTVPGIQTISCRPEVPTHRLRVLPPLLYRAAFTRRLRDLRQKHNPDTALAIGLVAAEPAGGLAAVPTG